MADINKKELKDDELDEVTGGFMIQSNLERATTLFSNSAHGIRSAFRSNSTFGSNSNLVSNCDRLLTSNSNLEINSAANSEVNLASRSNCFKTFRNGSNISSEMENNCGQGGNNWVK